METVESKAILSFKKKPTTNCIGMVIENKYVYDIFFGFTPNGLQQNW